MKPKDKPGEIGTAEHNMNPSRLSDSDHIAERLAVRISLATLAVTVAWIAFAMMVRHYIPRAYYGEGLSSFVVRTFGGHTTHPLDEYVARWNILTWSGLGVVLSTGAFLIIAAWPRPRWLVRFGLPVCAFLLARTLLWVGFAAAPIYEIDNHRLDGGRATLATNFNLESWSRWDSQAYLSIARTGYEFYPCDIPLQGMPIAEEGKGRGRWCGNAAWFPAYPALIWLLARIGVPELAGGVLLSGVFCLLTLFLLWNEFLGAERTVKSFLCLLLAALFPGAIYYHAVYPISMVLFFILLSLHFALKEQWKLCGVAGAAATLTYPPGAFLGIVFVAWVFYSLKDVTWSGKIRRIVTVGTIMSAGFALVFVSQRLFVGAWGTFYLAQASYKEAPSFTRPVTSLIDSAAILIHFDWAQRGPAIMAASTLLNAIVMVVLVAFSVRATRRSPADACLLIFLLVFWLAFLVLGKESVIRRQALLLPAVPLARHLPDWVLGALAVIALVLMPLVAMMYYSALMW
jgi:hypothetical protein